MKMDESGWKWTKVDENGWKWMKMDESGWKWMKVNESEWKWMKVDESGWKWMQISTVLHASLMLFIVFTLRSQRCFQQIFWGIYLLANILMTHPCSDKSPTARLLFENSCKHETSEKGLLWKVGCLKIVVIVKLQIASSSMRSMLRAVAKELKGFIFVAFRNFISGNWCRPAV